MSRFYAVVSLSAANIHDADEKFTRLADKHRGAQVESIWIDEGMIPTHTDEFAQPTVSWLAEKFPVIWQWVRRGT